MGIGSVTLHTSLGSRKLRDVMWIPSLAGSNNLLSIPQLIQRGCCVRMMGETCEITNIKTNRLFLIGNFDGKGFYVTMSTCLPSTMPSGAVAMLGASSDTQPLEVWHMRLSHLNEQAIRHLVTKSTGMTIGRATTPSVNVQCEPCLRGAQHRHISYLRGNPATTLLEHIWADVKGPLLENDVHVFRYFVLFIDEKSRYTTIYPLLKKADAFPAYKLFEARVERLCNACIINLHVDMGGKWMSNEMRAHCRNRGVELLFTAGYAPSMNSISERAIRTVIEHASALLWAANLPVGFWVFAVKTSVYLLNRSPHSTLVDMITPYQAWFNRIPNLGHLRIFGCRAAVHVPDELRDKTTWTSKSTIDCIFVGYSETENLFDIWDIQKRTILRKRDVVFWENQLVHPLLAPRGLPHVVSIYSGVAGEMVPQAAVTGALYLYQ